MPRISTRDLRKVEGHPEVKAAIEALDAAAAATRAAYLTYREADQAQDRRAEELNTVATRVLAEQNQEG